MTENGRKFGEKLGKVAGGTARVAGESWRFVNRIVIAVIVVAVVAGLWLVRDMFTSVKRTITNPIEAVLGPSEPPKPAEERDPELQRECFTAIIAKDSEEELGQHLGAVRLEIADAVLRLRVRNPGLTTCDIMRKALTYYPLNWEHRKEAPMWQDRSASVIRKGQSNSAWTSAELVAKEKYTARPRADRCATHYIRAQYNRLTAPFSGEGKAREVLESTMRSDPALTSAGFKTKFFCP